MTENAVASVATVLTMEAGQYSAVQRKLMADNARYLAMLKKMGVSTDELGVHTVSAGDLMKKAMAAVTRANEMMARATEMGTKASQSAAVQAGVLAEAQGKATAATKAQSGATLSMEEAYAQMEAQGIHTVAAMEALSASAAQATASSAKMVNGQYAWAMSNREFAASQASLTAAKEEDTAATGNETAVMAEYNKVAAQGGEVTNILAAAFDKATAAGISTTGAMEAAVIAAGEYTAATEGATAATVGLVSGASAANDAMRVLSGSEFGAARGAAQLLTSTLGLGPVLSALFPLIGVMAMVSLLGQVGSQMDKMYEKANAAADAIGKEFDVADQKMQVTLDDAELTNSKLDDQIAKLEGHPGNGLETALLQAVTAADKLQESLYADNEQLTALLQKHEIAWYQGLFTGQKSTGGLNKDIEAQSETYTGSTAQATLNYDTAMRSAGNDPKKIAAAQAAREKAVHAASGRFLGYLQGQLGTYEQKKKSLDDYDAGAAEAVPGALLVSGEHKYGAAIKTLQGMITRVKLAQGITDLQLEAAPKQAEVNRLHGEGKTARAGRNPLDRVGKFDKEQHLPFSRLTKGTDEKATKAYYKSFEVPPYAAGGEDWNKHDPEFQRKMDKLQRNSQMIATANQRALSLAQINIQEKQGALSPYMGAQARSGVNESAYKEQVGILKESLAKFGDIDFLLTDTQKEQKGQLQNQLEELKGIHKVELAREQAELLSKTWRGAAMQSTSGYLSQYSDANVSGRLSQATLQTTNESVAHAMTTGNGNFAGAFRSLGDAGATQGLGFVENKFLKGPLSKMLGTNRPKGSASDPIYVKMSGVGGVGPSSKGGPASLTTTISSVTNLLPTSAGPGGVLSTIGSTLTKALPFIAGFLATGGPVSAGLSYMVGERGPELFTSSSSGTIIPNHKLSQVGGGGDGSTAIHVDARGATDPAATAMAVQRGILAMGHAAVRQSMHAATEMKARTPR